MPPTSGNQDLPSIQQLAEQRATEVLARRQRARATRAAALAQHPRPIVVETRVTRAQLTEGALEATAKATEAAIVTERAQTAGYLIAIGDSWFDYPIHDVLTKLDDNYGYNIESSAHKGDPVEAMVSDVGQLDKFARLLDKVTALGATPKAILISGGGDDIAGDEFGMLINEYNTPIAGWNEQVVAGVIDTRIAGAYRMMFSTVNLICRQSLGKTLPILVHGYDYPVPDGRGFLGGWGPLPGPWLKPGFDEKRFSDLSVTTKMIAQLIDRFNTMLRNLLQEPGFDNVHYVDVRGTLSAATDYRDWWANELHPTGGDPLFPGKDGFGAVAAKFQAVLSQIPQN